MLMVYRRLCYAIRPMQEHGERLFEFERESYRVNLKNASDRLLHAFPTMIAAIWTDANDYLSNRRADWDESKMCETKKHFDNHFRKWLSNFCPLSPLFPLPPFCPPLSPTTPITPYNPPNSPPQTNKLFEAPMPKWWDNCDNQKRQPDVSQRFFPPTTLYLQKLYR